MSRAESCLVLKCKRLQVGSYLGPNKAADDFTSCCCLGVGHTVLKEVHEQGKMQACDVVYYPEIVIEYCLAVTTVSSLNSVAVSSLYF